MAEFTTSEPTPRGTSHASLAALAIKLGELDLLAPIREGDRPRGKRRSRA